METLEKVGLGEFRVTDRDRTTEVSAAMAWLKAFAPGADEAVRRNTTRLVWVEPKERAGAALFASCTFFEQLGTTYLTPLALRYLPPDIVVRGTSPYPLAENLYHEAIHQELFRLVEAGEVLRTEARGDRGPRVAVSWRKTTWTLEHALHAMVVYRRVGEIRRIAVARGELGDEALHVARAAAEELRSQLLGLKDCLGGSGRELLS